MTLLFFKEGNLNSASTITKKKSGRKLLDTKRKHEFGVNQSAWIKGKVRFKCLTFYSYGGWVLLFHRVFAVLGFIQFHQSGSLFLFTVYFNRYFLCIYRFIVSRLAPFIRLYSWAPFMQPNLCFVAALLIVAHVDILDRFFGHFIRIIIALLCICLSSLFKIPPVFFFLSGRGDMSSLLGCYFRILHPDYPQNDRQHSKCNDPLSPKKQNKQKKPFITLINVIVSCKSLSRGCEFWL